MEPNPRVTFGEWLKKRRKSLDLTQRELAKQIGCATITLQKIEADQRRPSKQMAELLAGQLNVPDNERQDFIKFARTGADKFYKILAFIIGNVQLPGQ